MAATEFQVPVEAQCPSLHTSADRSHAAAMHHHHQHQQQAAAAASPGAASLARTTTAMVATLAQTLYDYPLRLLAPVHDPGESDRPLPLGALGSTEDYELLERRGLQLGCGVFRALLSGSQGLSAKRVVALKRKPLPPPVAGAEAERARARALVEHLREAFALSMLQHPGVLRLARLARSPRRCEVALELPFYEYDLDYLLRARLARGGAHARSCALQLLRALRYLHARGLAHRDLRPSSVLCASLPSSPGQFPRLVLAGFGSAIGATEPAAAPTSQSRYHAPEVAAAVATSRGAAIACDWRPGDVWSAAAVVAEVLTGAPLFTPAALLDLARGAPGTAMPALEVEDSEVDVAELLASLLVARQRRPTAAQALAHCALAPERMPEEPADDAPEPAKADFSDRALQRFIDENGYAESL